METGKDNVVNIEVMVSDGPTPHIVDQIKKAKAIGAQVRITLNTEGIEDIELVELVKLEMLELLETHGFPSDKIPIVKKGSLKLHENAVIDKSSDGVPRSTSRTVLPSSPTSTSVKKWWQFWK